MGQPLSVFFSAQRSEDYDEGGEAYLTFNGKCNLISTLLKRYYVVSTGGPRLRQFHLVQSPV